MPTVGKGHLHVNSHCVFMQEEFTGECPQTLGPLGDDRSGWGGRGWVPEGQRTG